MIFWVSQAAAGEPDLDGVARELAPYVRDEVGREFLEVPLVHRVTRAEAAVRWRDAIWTVDMLAEAPSMCRRSGGRWLGRDRLCAAEGATTTTFARTDAGAAIVLVTPGHELRPSLRRVLLAAIRVLPAHSQAGEVLALGDRAAQVLPVEHAEPGWRWLVHSAFIADSAGDPDGCIRLASAALKTAPEEARSPIAAQISRCAWDSHDNARTTDALLEVAPLLELGDIEQAVARLLHWGQPALALRLLDFWPDRPADVDINTFRVHALVDVGRLDDALAYTRAHRVDVEGRGHLADALSKAGRRAEAGEIRASVCAEAPGNCR